MASANGMALGPANAQIHDSLPLRSLFPGLLKRTIPSILIGSTSSLTGVGVSPRGIASVVKQDQPEQSGLWIDMNPAVQVRRYTGHPELDGIFITQPPYRLFSKLFILRFLSGVHTLAAE